MNLKEIKELTSDDIRVKIHSIVNGQASFRANYAGDLGAMARAEKFLETQIVTKRLNSPDLVGYPVWPWYIMELCNVIGIKGARPSDDIELQKLISATARQRAEAFLSVMQYI